VRGIMFVVAYLVGCSSSSVDSSFLETDAEPIALIEEVEGRPDLVRILLDCEHACPSMPYIEVMKLPKRPELDSAKDSEEVETEPIDTGQEIAEDAAKEPVDCSEDYEFADCCGNGTCEDSESAFFCPSDCEW